MNRGRPKGYTPYTEISYEELGDWVGRKTNVSVCKKWLESLGYQSESDQSDYGEVVKQDSDTPKIEYTLTQL